MWNTLQPVRNTYKMYMRWILRVDDGQRDVSHYLLHVLMAADTVHLCDLVSRDISDIVS